MSYCADVGCWRLRGSIRRPDERKGTWGGQGAQRVAGRKVSIVLNCARCRGRIQVTYMKKVLLYTILGIAVMLILAVQPIEAQDRSEEYEQGYRDAVCDLFRDLAPLL